MLKRIILAMATVMMLTCGVFASSSESSSKTPLQKDLSSASIRELSPELKLTSDVEISDILPVDVESKKEDGISLLIKTFEVPPDTDPAEFVEENLVRNNVEYMLREITKLKLPGEEITKIAADNFTLSAPSEKKEDILPLLPEFLDYNMDGYIGKLLLDESSIRTEVEDTEKYSYTVKDTREYTCLDRNDPYLIPKTVEKNGITLSLFDIKWSGGNENSVEGKYAATVLYTGKAYGSKPGSYLITANYSGEVSMTSEGNIQYKVIYEPIPTPILPKGFDWVQLLSVTLIVVAGIGGLVGIFLLIRKIVSKRNRRKAEDSETENFDTPPRPARRKPQGFIHMQRNGGNEDD